MLLFPVCIIMKRIQESQTFPLIGVGLTSFLQVGKTVAQGQDILLHSLVVSAFKLTHFNLYSTESGFRQNSILILQGITHGLRSRKILIKVNKIVSHARQHKKSCTLIFLDVV